MSLPAPRDKLFGCIWLPRIRFKAQQYKTGKLSADYARAFCLKPAVDGQFLNHFQTDKEALVSACDLSDSAFEKWFRALPGNGNEHIAAWNEIAINLGRPGYPMEDRLPLVATTIYGHLAHLQLQTVFQVLEADEDIPAK